MTRTRFVSVAALVMLAAAGMTEAFLRAQQPTFVAPATKKAAVNWVPVPQRKVAVNNREPAHFPVLRVLNSRTDIDVQKMPLVKFAEFLSLEHKIPFRLDREALKRAHVAPNTPVTAAIKGLPLDAALRRILLPLKLEQRVVQGVVFITDQKGPEIPAAQEPIVFQAPQRGVRAFVEIAPNVRFAQGMVRMNPEQQAFQQMRPLMQVELHFVRKICHPTKEHMRQIKEELEKYVKERSDDFVAMRRGGAVVVGPQRRARPVVAGSISNTYSLLQDKLTSSVESHLSREAAGRYRNEVEKRSADRRRICVLNLVAILDRELCLSAKQRERLCSVLLANWNATWYATVEMAAVYGQDYVPPVPDDVIEPYLDAAQTEIWEGMQKLVNVNWGLQALQVGFGGMALPDLEDDE